MKGSCEECPDPLDCVELWFYIELVQFCVPEFVEVREVCGELKAEQTIHTQHVQFWISLLYNRVLNVITTPLKRKLSIRQLKAQHNDMDDR